MATKSFFEVLTEQMRAELREELKREFEAQVRTQAFEATLSQATAGERLETWLAARTSKTIFSRRAQASRAYPKGSRPKEAVFNKKASDTSPTARKKAETAEEQLAVELLRRQSGIALPEYFSETELKAAWRKAALKTHPDRFAQSDQITQAQAGVIFRELASAFATLSGLFARSSATQAA